MKHQIPHFLPSNLLSVPCFPLICFNLLSCPSQEPGWLLFLPSPCPMDNPSSSPIDSLLCYLDCIWVPRSLTALAFLCLPPLANSLLRDLSCFHTWNDFLKQNLIISFSYLKPCVSLKPNYQHGTHSSPPRGPA